MTKITSILKTFLPKKWFVRQVEIELSMGALGAIVKAFNVAGPSDTIHVNDNKGEVILIKVRDGKSDGVVMVEKNMSSVLSKMVDDNFLKGLVESMGDCGNEGCPIHGKEAMARKQATATQGEGKGPKPPVTATKDKVPSKAKNGANKATRKAEHLRGPAKK